jgi:hypothetical protein
MYGQKKAQKTLSGREKKRRFSRDVPSKTLTFVGTGLLAPAMRNATTQGRLLRIAV